MVVVLLLASGVLFIWRGPVRAVSRDYPDFREPYASARAWFYGNNPYSEISVGQAWQSGYGEASAVRIAPMYPPSTLPFIAAFAWLKWPMARSVWLSLNICAAFLFCVATFRLIPTSLEIHSRLLVLATVLAFAPLHTGFGAGQISFFVIALVIVAIWQGKNNPTLAGMVLGFATALKPQLVLPLVGYYYVIKEQRKCFSAIITFLVLTVIGVGHIHNTFPGWVHALSNNAQYWFQPGSVHDYAEGPNRFHLINAQMPLYTIVHSRTWANSVAWLVFILMAWCWIRLLLVPARHALLGVAGICAITLIPTYHRGYDAGLLVVALVWALPQAIATRDRISIAALVCLSAFLFPSAAALGKLTVSGNALPKYISEASWWRVLVLPHQGWALIGLSLVLIHAYRTHRYNLSQTQLSEQRASQLVVRVS